MDSGFRGLIDETDILIDAKNSCTTATHKYPTNQDE
jgi:hypothetical protein